MKNLSDIVELEILLTNEKSFYIFKHSTICPTSARAEQNVKKFIELNPKNFGSKIYSIFVIDQRKLSMFVANKFSVTHESPQILLIKNGKCIWHTSHLAINEEVMEEKLDLI